ncbi:MAG: CoB--CoM heterodisulfide reductase iron-sulfur subunit B family protein [Chloroflexi bacterium]|nr:CoB--CoM heterodisulfide reductase iron-sulfur subunit B family protein [Chloroflexota bacterium]
MKIAYYESCSLPAMGKEYDQSIRFCCDKLGTELVKIEDWMCCGSTVTHHNSRLLSAALPMRNLMAVEKMELDAVIVPCSACYARFKNAQHEFYGDEKMRRDIEEVLGYKFNKKIDVLHPLEFFSTPEMLAKIEAFEKCKIEKVKIASYYGCLLVRPPHIVGFNDNTEYPMTMDNILRAAGYKTIDWSYKTECCGGYFTTMRPDIVKSMSEKIFDNALACGAGIIANPCIFCQTNLDTRQKAIEQAAGKKYAMPVVYFTQLLGMALGASGEQMHFKTHFIGAKEIASKVVCHG